MWRCRENATTGLLLAQWAPYLVLDIIFRGPFSDIGGKVGVKLDPGAEGRLWARGRGMLASAWPAPAAAVAAAPGTACKSGATYQESEQEYHCLLEVHRQSTLQPMHRDSHTDARQAGLSVFNIAHLLGIPKLERELYSETLWQTISSSGRNNT